MHKRQTLIEKSHKLCVFYWNIDGNFLQVASDELWTISFIDSSAQVIILTKMSDADDLFTRSSLNFACINVALPHNVEKSRFIKKMPARGSVQSNQDFIRAWLNKRAKKWLKKKKSIISYRSHCFPSTFSLHRHTPVASWQRALLFGLPSNEQLQDLPSDSIWEMRVMARTIEALGARPY